jgi:multidrug efflux pump subunit AcrA (membrane-fusion protein)
VFRYGEGMAVFVVDGDRVRRRVVSTGRRSDFSTEITGGLSAGEKIAVYPPRELDDGTRVRISP